MKSRKGSALLIVLGLLSFMIISAVAFAAYMRFSRMPSSFLRRTSASREMVKAALARAIDDIDATIGNNPHPGVGSLKTKLRRKNEDQDSDDNKLKLRNLWLRRVFFGDDSYESDSDTVPVLTLEALAYLPPSLVNDVRCLSRHTPTAAWKMLDFDVGRYAYCAVDVSDYLDINKLFADKGRSSDPRTRITLSHVVDDGDRKNWDKFMDNNFRSLDEDGNFSYDEDKEPLISLADYNLAMGNGGPPKYSPFYDFVNLGRAQFYGSSSPAQKFARQTFVTDSYFPPNSGDYKDVDKDGKLHLCDLSYDDGQPFDFSIPNVTAYDIVNSGGKSVVQTGNEGSEFDPEWRSQLPGLTLAALYDYLDTDNIPLSLSIPTTERVPMICGIMPNADESKCRFQIRYDSPDTDTTTYTHEKLTVLETSGETRKVSKTELYYLHIDMPNALKVMTVEPFLHKDIYAQKNFAIDGRVSFFLSSEQMTTRATGSKDILSLETGDDLLDTRIADGVLHIKLEEKDIPSLSEPENEEDAVNDEIVFNLAKARKDVKSILENKDNVLLGFTYEWDQQRSMDYKETTGGVERPGWGPGFDEIKGSIKPTWSSGLKVLTKDGAIDARFKDNEEILKHFILGTDSQEVYMNMAIWLRVKDDKSHVVDMVPACTADDKQITDNKVATDWVQSGGNMLGKAYPLMKFCTNGENQDRSFTYSLNDFRKICTPDTPVADFDMTLWPKGAMSPDPRFNYAPEQWKVLDDFTKERWLANCGIKEKDEDGYIKDEDIFMSTSDAGYLQSKFEIAMLPNLINGKDGFQKANGEMGWKGGLQNIPTQGYPGIPSSPLNEKYMWRTYRILKDVKIDESEANEIDKENLAFEIFPVVNGLTGFKINPYSDSPEVIKSALINSPADWHFANRDAVSGDAEDFIKNYAWSKDNSKDKSGHMAITDDAITEIAKALIDDIRDRDEDFTSGSKYLPAERKTRYDAWKLCSKEKAEKEINTPFWLDSFRDIFNKGSGEYFIDNILEGKKLWSVDRKFLYGFWRECFDVKQQLFLVFVRAEPVMMGGGGVGQIPPQLGARAVALVWRNPDPVYFNGARQDDYPHQTRILFYRQLD